MVNYHALTKAVNNSSKKKAIERKPTYSSNKERFTIGKYAAETGHGVTARKFSSMEKPLNESNLRFCDCYKDELQKPTQQEREMKKGTIIAAKR